MTAKSRTTNREVASVGGASPRFRDLVVQIWPIDKLIPDPMDLPSIQRQTDAEGLDYFEVPISFTEIGDE